MSDNRHQRRGIARERHHAFAAARKPSSPLLFVILAFLALIQSSIVQTHIHVYGSEVHPAVAAALDSRDSRVDATTNNARADAAPVMPRDTYPPSGDPANCPLCQEVAQLGHFMHSATILVAALDFIALNFILPDTCRPASSAVPHFWHCRAPPAL